MKKVFYSLIVFFTFLLSLGAHELTVIQVERDLPRKCFKFYVSEHTRPYYTTSLELPDPGEVLLAVDTYPDHDKIQHTFKIKEKDRAFSAYSHISDIEINQEITEAEDHLVYCVDTKMVEFNKLLPLKTSPWDHSIVREFEFRSEAMVVTLSNGLAFFSFITLPELPEGACYEGSDIHSQVYLANFAGTLYELGDGVYIDLDNNKAYCFRHQEIIYKLSELRRDRFECHWRLTYSENIDFFASKPRLIYLGEIK